MKLAEIMVVFSFSSLATTVGVSFPWWMWILAAFDILVRISDDHKEWLREKQISLIKDIKALEEIRTKLFTEIRQAEKDSGIKANDEGYE